MQVSLGINPITWSNDDLPELGGDTPLETCLSETRQAGYAGSELGGKFPRDPAVLGPLLARHGLRMVSGWYSARLLERSADAEIAAVADHLALHAALGAPVMVFAETARCVHGDRTASLKSRPHVTDWPEYGRRITRVAEHLAAQGVRMAYHHHMGTAIESEADIDRLMQATGDAVGLLLDTGHATYAGADPLALARRHARRIVHVHCKDVRRAELARSLAADRSFLDSVIAGVFTVPGDGDVDFPSVLSAVRDSGYSGWLVVEAEQDPAKAHPLTYATLGFRNLKALAEGAGFTVV